MIMKSKNRMKLMVRVEKVGGEGRRLAKDASFMLNGTCEIGNVENLNRTHITRCYSCENMPTIF